MKGAGLPPRFSVDEQRLADLAPTLSEIAKQSSASRLCQAIALSEGFAFNVMACSPPSVAEALVLWLGREVPKLRGTDVKMVRLVPRRQETAREGEALGRELFADLEVEDPVPRAIFIDATDTRSDEGDAWLYFLQRLNERRNHLEALDAPLTLLLPPSLDAQLPLCAPDLWSIRSVAASLELPLSSESRGLRNARQPTNMSDERWKSSIEKALRNISAAPNAPPSGSLAQAEVVTLRRQASAVADDDLNEALRILTRQAMPLTRDVPEERVQTLALLADLLERRGAYREALRVYQDHLLPTHQRNGDLRALAATKTAVARLLVRLQPGERPLDEIILEYLRKDASPSERSLAEMADTAVVKASAAIAAGDLDAALRLLQQEALPIYKKIGNLRGHADVLDRVADVLQARGQLDEALSIRQLQLPLLVGRTQERSRAHEKLALLQVQRGELKKAQEILEHHVLPEYVKRGDSARRARVKQEIARIKQTLAGGEEPPVKK